MNIQENAFVVGKTIGKLIQQKLAAESIKEDGLADGEIVDADDLSDILDRLDSSSGKKRKQEPVNRQFSASAGRASSDSNTVNWGPEQAVDSKNDLSTWGGFESISAY